MKVGYGTNIFGGAIYSGLLFKFLAAVGFTIANSSLFAMPSSKADSKAEIPFYYSYASGSMNYY